MVELHDWLDYVRRHPMLYRFDGLHSRGRSCKSDFHHTVGEAAISDDAFMDEYMNDEYEHHRKHFDKAVKDRKDDHEVLSRFAEFCEHKSSAYAWDRAMLKHLDWVTAPLDEVLHVVDVFSDDEDLVDDYIRDWEMSPIEHYWDGIKDDEGLINAHPPVAVWCHAGEFEIPLKDVFFVCPACHGEPQTEDQLIDIYGKKNGYPVFYCGSCGSEMCVDKHQDIRDFFVAMDIEPYPFNPEKKAEWKAILDARRAMGENLMEIKVGDRVVLKGRRSDADGNSWVSEYEIGNTVEVIEVRPSTTHDSERGVTKCSGIRWYYKDEQLDEETWGSARFHEIHSKAQPCPTPA